jgi:late competence protein required for DNA uptake (superfamily II DNA/RNA helicase)
MALLRRKLRCHYCNTQSRDTVSRMPETYHCRECDAVNHFDEANTHPYKYPTALPL